MKSIRLSLKQAAAMTCAVTDQSVLPEEFEDLFVAPQVERLATRQSMSPDLKKELQSLKVADGSRAGGSYFSPVAVRMAHAQAVPERAEFLLDSRARRGLPPVVVSHYKKGGTGKTTVLSNVAIALAEQGLRVLCIDADPQGTTTTLLGVDIEDPSLRTLQHVVFGTQATGGRPVALKDAIIPMYDNAVLDLIPSNIELSQFDRSAFAQVNRERLFERLLKTNAAFFARYDIILIDTNPGSNLLNFGLMLPATHVLMPVSLDVPSMKSMHLMVSEADEMMEAGGCAKDMIIVANVFQAGQKHSDGSLKALRQNYSTQMMKTVIPAYAGVSRQGWNHDRGRTLLEREPTAPVAKRLVLLANELAERAIWAPMGLGVLNFEASEGGVAEEEVTHDLDNVVA